MALKGNRLSLFLERAGAYRPVGMAMDSSLAINGDVVEIASMSARAKAFAAGRYGWRISINALYCADPAAQTYAQQLHILTQLLRGSVVKIIYTECVPYNGALSALSFPSIEYSGEAIVTGFTINAPVQGFANISIELQGTGELEVDDLDIVDGGKASTIYTDEIDGGDSTTVFTNILEGGKSV